MPEDPLATAMEILRTVLGTPDQDPTFPPGRWARRRTQEPELTEWSENAESPLLRNPNGPGGKRIKMRSPGYRQAMHDVKDAHPRAVLRAGAIRFEPLEPGVLGDVSDGVRIDPAQLAIDNDLFPGDSFNEKALDALRHELAHRIGYLDDDRLKPNPYNLGEGRKYSAQQVDQASHALHRKK